MELALRVVRCMKQYWVKFALITVALAAGLSLTASAQLFGSSEQDKAIIQKRAASLGPAHMRMCAEGIAKRYPLFPAKVVSWSPYLSVGDYRKVGGWKREGASFHYLFEDSLVIMGVMFEGHDPVFGTQFDRWYGAARCYFGRDGGAMRLLAVCASGKQAGLCRVPNPLVRQR